MPEMTLEYIIKKNNIDINSIEIDTSVAFPAMSGSFIGGNGDFVSLFEHSVIKRNLLLIYYYLLLFFQLIIQLIYS